MPIQFRDYHCIVLEKIIPKLSWQSYFRLQQTCRDMEQFPLIHRNLKVHFERYGILKWEGSGPSLELHPMTGMIRDPPKFTDFTRLYGMRLAVLRLVPVTYTQSATSQELVREFNNICVFLAKYHITCRDVNIYRLGVSPESCRTFFDILKPVNIVMMAGQSNRIQEIFRLKQVENVMISLDVEDSLVAVPSLLRRYQKVCVLTIHQTWIAYKFYNFFTMVVEHLRHQPLCKIREFQYMAIYNSGLPIPSTDDVLETFQDFNPTMEIYRNGRLAVKFLLEGIGRFEIMFDRQFAFIHYEAGSNFVREKIAYLPVELDFAAHYRPLSTHNVF